MEKGTVTQAEKAEKLMMRMIPLSSWRNVLVYQRLRDGVYLKEVRHMHYCGGCHCFMICSYENCGSLKMSCPECSTKNQTPQGGY